MPIRKIRKEISELIAESRIQKAFLSIREQLNPESSYYDDLIIAQAAFSRYCERIQKGLIDWDDYERGCARTSQNLLVLSRKITEEDLLFPAGFKSDTLNMPNEKESVLVKNSRQAHIYITKARKLRKEEKYAESIAELRQAIELKPYSIASKTDLAALLRQTQEYDEAIDILNMILKEFPRDAHSRNELASCYREKYELDLARRILKDGLILVKNNNHFYTNLFIIHLFFSCEVDNALDIKKEYLNLTGEELIRDKMVRQKYDDFIHHFEAIHSGQADHELNGKYLEECISSKRAYQTAAKLLNKLLKTHPESFWYTRLRKELPPQYNAFFDL